MGSTRRAWYLHPDGHAIDRDDLVETPRGWVLPRPMFCTGRPRHVLADGEFTLGWTACEGCRRGHLLYTCGQCGGRVYQPELAAGCRPLAFDRRDGVSDGD